MQSVALQVYKMSYKNRKFMYDKGIAEGRTEFICKKLKDEFGKPTLKSTKPEDIVVKVEEVKKVYTDKELYALNKAEQTVILNKLGITKIPNLEADRVKAIQEANK